MGAFDDLVPAGKTAGAEGFADLIPAAPSGGVMDSLRGAWRAVSGDVVGGVAQRTERDRQAMMQRAADASQRVILDQAGSGTADQMAARAESLAAGREAQQPGAALSAANFLRDQAISGAQGVIGLGEAVVGLGDLATGWTGITPGSVLESLGYDPGRTKKSIGALKSDAGKLRDAIYESTRGFTDTLVTLGANPALLADKVSESLVGTVGAGAAGQAAVKMLLPRVTKAAAAAGLTGEAAEAFIADRITKVAIAASAGAEGAQQAGNLAEEARQAGRTWGQYVIPSIASGAITGGISLASGRLADKVGLGDVESDIALRGVRGTGVKTDAGFLLNRAAIEGVKEGVLEEMPQSAQEQAWQNVAMGRPVGEGVAKAAASGLATGAGMGGGHAMLTRPQDKAPENAGAAPANAGAVPASDVLGAPEGKPAEQSPAEKALYTAKDAGAVERVREIDAALADAPNAEQAADLQAERANLTREWPIYAPGVATQFSTEAGARLEGRYALAEADQLVSSHDTNLRQNPRYPQELQPRARERAASEMQISQIVQRLDPARLGESADVATGAPIVGPDGLVESGNARTIALARTYEANGQKAADYRQFLKDNAARFGIDPATVDSMQKPVLVRVRATPVNRAEFARQANAATVAQMSPSEQAKADAARIDSMDDLTPDENGNFATSRSFIRRFMGRLPGTEQAGMMDAGGQLSQTGYARVRNAVLAKAYGDSPVLLRMVESMDDSLRNVTKALMQVAPTVAKARESIAAGALFASDIAPDLLAAVAELGRIKESGGSVQDRLAQAGMFGDTLSAEGREFLAFMAENARSARRIGDFIQAYYDALAAAGNPAQGSLLGETAAPGKGDLMAAARKEITREDGQQAPDAGRGGTAGDQAVDAQGRGQPGHAAGDQGGHESHAAAGSQTGEWVAFPPDTGTLGIPRADMPQVKGEHRGALVQFLAGRGITHETIEEAPAESLKPTQAEFSLKKAEKWKHVREGTDRSVMASSDGYILDGHHQWVAALATGEPVKVIRFSAPIRELLAAVHAFPQSHRAEGADQATLKARAVDNLKDALAGLGEALLAANPLAMKMLPMDTPGLMPALVRVLKAALVVGKFKVKELIQHAKKLMREDPKLKPWSNKVSEEAWKAAADQALKEYEAGDTGAAAGNGQRGLFDAVVQRGPAQSGLFDQPTKPEQDDGEKGQGRRQEVLTDEGAPEHPAVLKLSKRGRGAVAILREDGYWRKELESHYLGGEKFVTRLHYKRGEGIAAGFGGKTFVEMREAGLLERRDVPRSSVWPEEWILKEEVRYWPNKPARAEVAPEPAPAPATTAQAEYYLEADKAARERASARKRDSSMKSPDPGSAATGSILSPESANLKTPPSGNSTYESPPDDAANRQPAGNLPGTSMDSTSSGQIVANSAAGRYNDNENPAQGGEDGNGKPGTGGTQGEGAGPASPTGGGGKPGDVRPGAGGRDQRSDLDAGGPGPAGEETGPPAADGPGKGPGRGGRAGPGNRPGPDAGIPAGRDIPLKSGRNYRFGDTDLTYAGSWFQKATQNVEAVELLKTLEREGRQATREEQSVLAKFVGWGASDLANNIFDEKKLDRAMEAATEWEEVSQAVKDAGGRVDMHGDWRTYYRAKTVIESAGKVVPYRDPITSAMLDKAKPDTKLKRWAGLRDRLKAVMTPEEWREAARSTQYAHYTSKAVVTSMLNALERMGFKGGTILEPGAGIGVFAGLMPEAMATSSSYTGIEFDSITGGILKQLFPDERILVESFIDTKLPKDFYDVAFGNPPFGRTAILSDPEYKKRAFSLHDYFFAKSIDRVKPGGLVVFVTSRFTMDKKDDKARVYLADRADLVGAIRLPQTAFKQNAGTDVVTDVLFLRKKVPGETFAQAQSWMGVKNTMTVEGKQSFPINEYFAAHPEMVLGQHSDKGSMANTKEAQYTVLPNEGDIESQFAAAAAHLPADIYKAARGSAAEAAKVREIDFNPTAQKEGNYYVTAAGAVMQREGGQGFRVEKRSEKDLAVLRSFVELRDALKEAQYQQLTGGAWQTALGALQLAYRRFVAKHGRINQFTMQVRKAKAADPDTGEEFTDEIPSRRFDLYPKFRDDPDASLVLALENINDDTGEITESAFLSERVLGEPAAARIETPSDALLTVLNEVGRVDIPAIADRLGISEKEAIEALGTAIYEAPGAGWQMADEYLSGNVLKKLNEAREAAKSDRRFERNVAALEAAQPAPLSSSDIDVALGQTWIPTKIYETFLHDLTGIYSEITYDPATESWNVLSKAGNGTLDATQTWGTPKRDAAEILLAGLSGRPIRITRTVGSGKDKKTEFDADATEEANQKLTAMRARFADWIWESEDRVRDLVPLYNDKFNAIRPRTFDGTHLTLPGSTTTIKVFDHVKRGAWRIIQNGNTYLAHAVGSGKTWQMVISAMEQKRLGLIKKPMMVVPNHMLQQFAREWLQLYPAARLMVADETQFHTDNRRRFVSRVALSDLDGVIITQSAFKILDLDPAFKARLIREELDVLQAALEQSQDEDEEEGNRFGSWKTKQIQAKIEKMEQKLEAAMSSEGKDKNVRFDEMGVDMLYVDEAHTYRKLGFPTNRQGKGIDSNGSDQAFDLFLKTRWLEEKQPGRSLVMASGTPVTNTLAELYSVMRFMAPQTLESFGLAGFDDWAAQFGRERTQIEPNAAGAYELVTRFQKFANVGELTRMFREFADVLTADQLAAMLGDKRPKVKGGGRNLAVTPKTETYAKFQAEDLRPRMETSKAWKQSRDEPNNPDPIIRIIGDGRLAAIDMRFMAPSLPSDPDSKLNKMADEVIRVWKETKDWEYTGADGQPEAVRGAAQMVFSDIGLGEGAARSRGFNARAWLEKRFRDAGIPAAEVAFMSDFKQSAAKLKLFKDVNAGRVKILVGSSKNMGTGVNAQQRLIALHHLDAPWFPADLEQREGRIIRQGNKNREVQIYAYAAKGSYDEQMWKTLASKAYFIEQALSGDGSVREVEDLSATSQYEVAAAMVAENPRVLELAGARAEVERLERLYRAHENNRAMAIYEAKKTRDSLDWERRRLPEREAMAERVQDLSGDHFIAEFEGGPVVERKEWGDALLKRFDSLRNRLTEGKQVLGRISGFDVRFLGKVTQTAAGKSYAAWLEMKIDNDRHYLLAEDPLTDSVGMVRRATNYLVGVTREPAETRQRIAQYEAKLAALEPRIGAKFQFAGMLADKRAEVARLEVEVTGGPQQPAGRLIFDPDEWANPTTMLSRADRKRGAAGMTVEDVHAVTDPIVRAASNLARVHVLASTNEAPADVVAWLQDNDAMDDAAGLYHQGEIYLFANNLAGPHHARAVLLHEGEHYGLSGLFGGALDETMMSLYEHNKSLRERADARRKAEPGLPLVRAVEEVLADMAGAGKAQALNGWKRLVARVREWLRKAGWVKEVSDNDVLALVRSAEQFWRAGKRPGYAHLTRASRDRRLADDLAAQERWLEREAKARGYKSIDDLAEKAYPVFEKLAAKWREQHPVEGAMLARAPMAKISRKILDWAASLGRRGASIDPVMLVSASPSDALKVAGVYRPIVVDMEHARHAMNAYPEITPSDFAALPDLLERPRAILKHSQGWRVILDSRDGSGNPLAVALSNDTLGRGERAIKVTEVSTLFGKEESAAYLAAELLKGNVLWMPGNEIAHLEGLLSRPQLPMQADGSATDTPPGMNSGRTVKILSDDALVNFRRNPREGLNLRKTTITLPENAPAILSGARFSRQSGVTDETPVKADGKWTVDHIPAVGEPFIVYRFGNDSGQLAGRNGGNAWGVVNYIMGQEDYDKPSNGEMGSHVFAYEVTIDQPFGAYQGITRGVRDMAVESGKAVGRVESNGSVAYSFPRDGAWTARTLGSVPLADLYAAIKRETPYRNFDGTGTIMGAQVLADAFSDILQQEGAATPRLSRASAAGHMVPMTPAQQADAVIADKVVQVRPLDWAARTVAKATGLTKASEVLLGGAGRLIDRLTPETVKAGVVSNYGIPEAVIDRRAVMQGRQREQLRGAGALLEKLATLTRAESRIAYMWMNSDDPQSSDYLMDQLPSESIRVLAEVEKMIDDLSQEAVALGQLDAEAFKRNRFAYLRRSYVKHTAELSESEAQGRARAISILGDQYKGRGMIDPAAMKKIQNTAPEWWNRKIQAGKADTQLKGERFIRFERRAHSGQGTAAMPGIGGKAPGKLLEIAYWPAGEAVPARFGSWDQAGTWEVIGTKGADALMWRDFSAQERQAMGEIDEVRFAIAKTLHGMIHDVETGRYLEWLSQHHGEKDPAKVTGTLVNASERMRDTFRTGEWVQVPDTKIPGTGVRKYGKLAGTYLPGPIWNDVRQVVGFRYRPLGDTFAAIQRAWKVSKTSLSPAVHMNNVMANFVMADWHDVGAGHVLKALKLMLSSDPAAQVIRDRFGDSGGSIGTWAVNELQREQLAPLIEALEKELGIAGNGGGQVGVYAALQLAMHGAFRDSWAALSMSKPGKGTAAAARAMMAIYEAEDQVFRLAAWLKAKEDGATDLAAGKLARASFLDYSINAPWIQMARSTALPFIAFTYRAVPMALNVLRHKPWKLMKLAAVAGALNAMGYLLSGGDEDDERKLLPEEKAGRIWGMVPKLLRMPWNDAQGSPVFLDVRRWVPIGDVFDLGQGHAAVPVLPSLVPGGPLALLAELAMNKQQFTGKPITLETDTATEKAAKVADYLYKAFAPNLLILPGTYAFTGAWNAGKGKTDAFGRELSLPQALLNSAGVKVGSYPKDVLQLNATREAQAKLMEIQGNITALKRERARNGLDEEGFRRQAEAQMLKKRNVVEDLQKRMQGGR